MCIRVVFFVFEVYIKPLVEAIKRIAHQNSGVRMVSSAAVPNLEDQLPDSDVATVFENRKRFSSRKSFDVACCDARHH